MLPILTGCTWAVAALALTAPTSSPEKPPPPLSNLGGGKEGKNKTAGSGNTGSEMKMGSSCFGEESY